MAVRLVEGSPSETRGPVASARSARVSQCSLWLTSILQVALLPQHEGVLEMMGRGGVGWGNLPRLLGDFTPLFLFNGLFGRQGVLLLCPSFLQLGLVKAGHFPPCPACLPFSYNSWILVLSSLSSCFLCSKRPMGCFLNTTESFSFTLARSHQL